MNIIWLLIKLCALVIQERIKGVPASYFYTINLILKPTLVCTAISLSILLVYFWCICFSNDSYSHFWSLFPGDWSFIDTMKRQFKKFIFILLLVLVWQLWHLSLVLHLSLDVLMQLFLHWKYSEIYQGVYIQQIWVTDKFGSCCFPFWSIWLNIA